MGAIEDFKREREQQIATMGTDTRFQEQSRDWMVSSAKHKYTYHFNWLGIPVIQFPQDLVALQEIIWETQPDAIVETGIAHGGSLVFSASMLELLGNDGIVIGVDIEIRRHNRERLEQHPLFKRIRLLEGSSVDRTIAQQVASWCSSKKRVMVILDSNHTHEHVLQELQLYSPLVTKDCYLIVFDTSIEDVPAELFPDRPWGKGNSPKSAVVEFLASTKRFVADDAIPNKLAITVAPGGYLKCVG